VKRKRKVSRNKNQETRKRENDRAIERGERREKSSRRVEGEKINILGEW
jgi:hypothetical protein